MGCDKPYRVSLVSQKPDSVFDASVTLLEGKTRWIDLDTPCRKCERCLQNRRLLWKGRMEKEIRKSFRTWFGTITINPQARFMFSLRAGSRDYHSSYRIISKEMTKYFKRLRKAGYKFRYVLVAESHKDGYPHLHLLVHEVAKPIPKKRLQSEWTHGFTNFKLVNDFSAAHYVAKYLAKDARTRIRASQEYGQCTVDFFTEIENLLKA